MEFVFLFLGFMLGFLTCFWRYTKINEEKLNVQKQEILNLQQKLASEFENISNRVLEHLSTKFTQENKTKLDTLLQPFKQSIDDFKVSVKQTYITESQERNALRGEVKQLALLNQQINQQAIQLTKALKGDSQVRGHWGEVMLAQILEACGLRLGEEYETQETFMNEEGKRLRPDVLIKLPENKHIIVDSKVSLIAYEAYVACEDATEKSRHLAAHVAAMRNHIKDLSKKNYSALNDLNTPDFVLLFVPIETSFALALQGDAELLNVAWENKIVLVGPSTLFATLKLIASVWKQERQTRNVLMITERGGRLYDKFVAFVEDLVELGSRLNQAQNEYQNVMQKLQKGKGNLITQAEQLKELGVKQSKALPESMLEDLAS